MEERIRHLFRKYLTNTCTKEEFEEVFRYLENAGSDPVMREEMRLMYEEEMGQMPSAVFVSEEGVIAGLEVPGVSEDEGMRGDGIPQEDGVIRDVGIPQEDGIPQDVGVMRDVGVTREDGFIRKDGVMRDVEVTQDVGVIRDVGFMREDGVPKWDGEVRGRGAGSGTRRAAVLALGAAMFIGGLVWLVRPARGVSADRGGMAALGKQVTHKSESKYVLLPDSTQVWLNAESTLEFPGTFNKGQRQVILTGEAYFDVRHAELTPFIIHTGRVSIEVLGTAFNIKAYPGQERINIQVQKGKVKVNVSDRPVALLTMGQQVSISNSDSSIRQKALPAQAKSWQEGNLVYDDNTIEDIVADLERVYNVSIRIDNPAVRKIRISTTFKRGDGVQKALEVLGELTDTEPVEENGQYVMR